MGEAHFTSKDAKIPFGKEMAKQFLIDPKYKNLNHGSFGTIPQQVHTRLRELQDRCEARPDQFIRYEYPVLLDKSRAAVAKILNVPTETVVFVPNATTGVNTVLRNISWNEDGKDRIIYFNFIYGACGKTINYVCESTLDLVQGVKIDINLPFEDEGLLQIFQETLAAIRSSGGRPRLALFDTIVSMPGIRLPFEGLIDICAKQDVLSLVDGAHGIGHIPLDLGALQPDFFVSNCHKWLYAPRGCAVFHVPIKHQDAMRSTLPTSHGFVPRGATVNRGPLPANDKSAWVSNFEFVGTIDSSPYLCIPESIKFRDEICGGEAAIMSYCTELAKNGGKEVAKILASEVLENRGTMTNCAMTNVRLPLTIANSTDEQANSKNTSSEAQKVITWMLETMMSEYNTFVPIILLQGSLWARLSGQIYLDLEDFVDAGKMLQTLVERVDKGEHLQLKGKNEVIEGGDLAEDGVGGV